MAMTWVYGIFILLAITGAIFLDKEEEWSKYKLLSYRGLYLLLIAIIGCSYGLGGDKFAYMRYFDNYYDQLDQIGACIAYEFIHMGFMPLWTFLVLLVKSTTDSFYVLQWVLALLVNIPICEIARRHTQHGFLFLLLYFVSGLLFQFNTEVMREGPAIALGLLAIEQFVAGKKTRFWTLTVLAMGFHISAIILLVLPWLKHITLTRKHILILLAVTTAAWALSDFVLMPVLHYFLPHSAGAFGQKIITYTSVQTTLFGFLRSFLCMMVVPMAAIYFNRQLPVSENERHYRESMTDLLIVVALIGCAFAGFTRFFNFVQVFYLIMLTELIAHLLETRVHLVFRIGTIMMALLFWAWYYLAYWPKNDWHFYQFFVPYTCIVDETDEIWQREDAYYEVCDFSFYDDRREMAE